MRRHDQWLKLQRGLTRINIVDIPSGVGSSKVKLTPHPEGPWLTTWRPRLTSRTPTLTMRGVFIVVRALDPFEAQEIFKHLVEWIANRRSE